MRKIGILVNSIGYGGNERSAVNIATTLKDEYDVTIITQEDGGNQYDYGGRVVCLDTPCAKSRFRKVLNAIRRIIRLKEIIAKHRIETLLIILPTSNPINYIKFKGCKKIVSCRDCGDLIKNTNKYIKMTERSDLMVCNSIEQAEYLTNANNNLKSKIITIYNIVNIHQVHLLANEKPDPTIYKFMEGHKCIISTSRFAKAKGLNNLIKAFSILARKDDNYRLIMIGDGEQRTRIVNLINDLELTKKVLLPGFQSNPFRYISLADVYVLPSFFEGFPNTLVEAMTCGTPVIATDCPSGPAEILCGKAGPKFEITEYGVLVRSFSEETSTWTSTDITEDHINLAQAVEKTITDSNLRINVIENSRKRVECFSNKAILGKWAEIL